MQYLRALWWIKRDARLYDNVAYTTALREADEVLPLYVNEPLLCNGPDWSPLHTYAMQHSLSSLHKNLCHHESALFWREGAILDVLEALYAALPFQAIYAHEETGLLHTYERDRKVKAWCLSRGIHFKEFSQNGVTRGLKNRDNWQENFMTCMLSPVLPVPTIRPLPKPVRRQSGRLPEAPTLYARELPLVGERVAHETMRHFLNTRAVGYSGGVSSMLKAPVACSRLSVHLAWGTLSLRTVFQATVRRREELPSDGSASQWRRSLRSFESRLFWHSHFVQRLEDQPDMEQVPIHPAFYNALPVVDGEEAQRRLIAWRTGETGFPMIDAAMRYYQETGWLNFRSRAMITSFAVHALRLPWQTIVYELAKMMIDYVPGIHVSQVQMQTGVTGINTIRVYSPSKQQQDHDPDCIFIKRWIPELADVTPAHIVKSINGGLTPYRDPIVDFKTETKLMKDALYAIKKSVVAQSQSHAVYQKHGSRKKRDK